MNVVAILGAGDLGASLARLVLDRELARSVWLVDPDEERARGKALDLRQEGAVSGSDTVVEGRGRLHGSDGFNALVVADPVELSAEAPTALRVADYARALAPGLGEAPLVVAGADAAGLIEAAIAAGVPADQVLGSAPVAWSSALRRLLAEELGVAAREVVATTVGLPPHLVPVGVAVAGLGVDALPPRAVHRAGERLRARRFGPVALATAALRVLHALDHRPPSLLPIVTARGPGGAVGMPVRLGGGRILDWPELPLDPRLKVAFENAAARG